MDVGRALARIGLDGAIGADRDALAAIQRAFLHCVPFENLDLHCGRGLRIAPAAVFAKIVGEHRGGLCYECNGLLHDLLAALGFRVRMISARMAIRGRLGPPFDHMALIVELDRPWLVDAGNGRSCREPLPLDDPGFVARAEGVEYHVAPWDLDFALFYREAGGDWAPRFLFDTRPRRREEFAAMALWHGTAADAPFTQRPLATLALPDGRVTLAGDELIETRGERRDSRRISSEAERLACLREVFGIELPARLPWPPAGVNR